MKGLFLTGTLVCALLAVEGPIVFEEIAQQSGLNFVSNSSPTPNKNQPETMVAGVALFDYDNDGYLDVYFVNGAAIPSLQKESPCIGTVCFTTIMTVPSPTSRPKQGSPARATVWELPWVITTTTVGPISMS